MSKSTGPRTPKGKARSSQNAAKHWIESRRILPEEQGEAAVLRGGFEADFKPESLIEHEIIDDLVFNRLHKRRIDIVMTRDFQKQPSKKRLSCTKTRSVQLPGTGSAWRMWWASFRASRLNECVLTYALGRWKS